MNSSYSASCCDTVINTTPASHYTMYLYFALCQIWYIILHCCEKIGYHRYTSFELRQDIDAKQQYILSWAKSVSSQKIHCKQTNSLSQQIHCNTYSLQGRLSVGSRVGFARASIFFINSTTLLSSVLGLVVNTGVGSVAQQCPI